MRRVLITGSRDWTHYQSIHDALDAELRAFGRIIVVHGGARGTDTIASNWCVHKPNVREEDHPAEWVRYGRSAGTIRNVRMVNLGADICYAFPLAGSRGTRHCMKVAAQAGIKVVNLGEAV